MVRSTSLLRMVVLVSLVLGLLGPVSAAPAPPGLPLDAQLQAGPVTLDGTVSSNTGAANATSVGVSHTTGSGANRLLLVGVSWNAGSTDRTISSVTFSYGATTLTLSEVVSRKHSSQNRHAAIYRYLAPPVSQSGTVTVTFSGAVTNGIVVGVANFANVDQTTPVGVTNSADGNSTAPSVTLSGLNGDELVLDTVFQGATDVNQTLTVDANQTERWNAWISNTRAAGSTEQATGSSVTMSWTAASSSYWVIVGAAIKPVAGPSYNLTVAVSPTGAGTTVPAVGTHVYAGGTVVNVTASAALGYAFSAWSGACTGSGACSVTMDANKTVTATFTTVPTYTLTMAVSPSGAGTTNPSVGPHAYNQGTVVNVTATPNAGYAFRAWAGACTGDGACSVTMNANKTVTATFGTAIGFLGTELLGRPTANSISVSVVPSSSISLLYQYGTSPGVYTGATVTTTATALQPKVVVISGLTANTKYYYRMKYSSDGGTTWVVRPEYSFWTQRAANAPFTFDVTSDSHVNIVMGSASTWTNTLNDVNADDPDFMLDLGDTVAMDNVSPGGVSAAESAYKFQLPFFNRVSNSAAIFLTAGNHEQTEGWHVTAAGTTITNSLPVLATNAQKKFFLNPVPDSFYTGDSQTFTPLDGDDLREDYYAWTWGDALFVVIDPFWFSTTKPYISDPGGGESDTTGSGDAWDWTLGQTQFNWLKTTLQNSTAKYKFVFSHQMTSDGSISGQEDYGHGGANHAKFVEWGGYNEDGSTWGWTTERAGWGSQTVSQTMAANGVSIFFHGHDHQMAYESVNGVVYQAVPSAGFTGSFGVYTTGDGKTIWADSTQGPGHLRVTVGPCQTTVDFIRTSASTPVYSYSVPAAGPACVQTQIPLNTGWNLISSPLIPQNTLVTQTISSITGSYNLVYAYNAWDAVDPWKTYNIARPPALNDMAVITEGIGIWLNATAPVTLTIAGTQPVAPSIKLAAGWNLVGYPIQTSKPVTVALQSIAGNYDLVYAYNAWDTGDPWKTYNIARPPALNDLKTMGPGWGYWIHTTAACTWTP